MMTYQMYGGLTNGSQPSCHQNLHLRVKRAEIAAHDRRVRSEEDAPQHQPPAGKDRAPATFLRVEQNCQPKPEQGDGVEE
jgi:hypothetical protein